MLTTHRTILVRCLSSDTSEEDLRKHFKQYGQIEKVTLNSYLRNNKKIVSGFVIFKFVDDIGLVSTKLILTQFEHELKYTHV